MVNLKPFLVGPELASVAPNFQAEQPHGPPSEAREPPESSLQIGCGPPKLAPVARSGRILQGPERNLHAPYEHTLQALSIRPLDSDSITYSGVDANTSSQSIQPHQRVSSRPSILIILKPQSSAGCLLATHKGGVGAELELLASNS